MYQRKLKVASYLEVVWHKYQIQDSFYQSAMMTFLFLAGQHVCRMIWDSLHKEHETA